MENIVKLTTKKYLGRKQVVLDCKFQIENGKEVQKVLAVGAKPVLNEINVANTNINFAGKVNLKLVYITESGERECLNCIADFNEFYENSEIEIGDMALIDLKVVDVTTPSIKANEVKVACILDAVINLCKNLEYNEVDEQENVFYKTSEKQVARQIANIKDTFDLSEEFKIEGDLKCLLNIDVNLSVKECYCGSGFAVISGDSFVSIAYEDEQNEIKMYKTSFPFKQEVACEDANTDCAVYAEANVLEYLAKCSVIQSDNCNIVKWEAPISILAEIFENNKTLIYDDAYSVSHLLTTNYTTNESLKSVNITTLEENIKGELPLKDGENATLSGNLFGGVEVSSAYMEDDKLCVEGVVSTTIIYKTQDMIEHSVIAEFPYISKMPKSELSCCNEINVKANLVDIDVSLKNSKLELITKILFNVVGFENDAFSILNGIEQKEERKAKDCAMEIVISNEEQSLWELGKKLGVSTEQIQKQNPKLQDVIHKNDKIVIYYNYTK